MKELGMEASAILKVLSSLKICLVTNKSDLRDNYPFGLFTVPQSEVVRIHASSGTTGKPTVVGYTQYDLDIWTEVVARSLTILGYTEATQYRLRMDTVLLQGDWDCIMERKGGNCYSYFDR